MSSVRRTEPIRVAIIAPSLDVVGGQAVQADRLLRALRGAPEIQAALVPINPRLPRPFRWLQRIKYVRTVVTSFAYLLRLLYTIPSVDVVHIFSASYFSFILAPTPALVVARLFRKPTLLNYHSGEAEEHLSRWKRTAMPVLRWADRIVVPSNYLAEVFGKFGLRAQAIPNSLDLERFTFRLRREIRPAFLCNRSHEPHYRVDVVIRAFALIQKVIPEARLLLAGDGSERLKLYALADNLGCTNVDFLGLVAPGEIADLYHEADVFLNASEVDNMPLSILEACASGMPVVSSDAGGIPRIVEHERTGLLVPPGQPEALAGAVLRLFEEPALAQRLSREGRRELEERYATKSVIPAWIELYRELADLVGMEGRGSASRPSVSVVDGNS